jgi:putative cell wall-binding protein
MLGFMALTASAAKPEVPTQAIQAAELAIKNADQARVADYASPELTMAREKLTAARTAVEKEDMVIAQRLAEQSRVDAELATAKASVAKEQAINDEMKKSIETLKQEMQRNSGARP